MHIELQNWEKRGQYFHFQGHNLFYIEEGTGPNLLILHGYPYSSFEWKYIWEELTGSFKVLIIDLLGMGFSDKPSEHNYNYEEHAHIINQLLKYLHISETKIMAHDLGVSIAQELISGDAESKNSFTIHSIAFLNGGLFMDSYQPRLIQRILSQSPAFIGKLLSQLLSRQTIEKSIKSLFGPFTQPSSSFLDAQWEVLNFKNGKSIAYLIGRLIFEKVNHQERWINSMIQTNIPMCYINGPFDPNSGIHMANRYKELIPNANVYLLDQKVGHWPQIEDPNGVLNAYKDFLKKIFNKSLIKFPQKD